MSKSETYRKALQALADWDDFLLAESGLPGPRGNLELAQVVADEGDAALFQRYLSFDAQRAPTNSPQEFLFFCGVVGLGKLLAKGDRSVLATLRTCAADPRWRTREGVAMALQRWGEADMDALLQEMVLWSAGSAFEQRAAAAGLCEPKLLHDRAQVEGVLDILDRITASMEKAQDRKAEGFQALKKGMGYCWSVAVAANPEAGKKRMETWFASSDKDVRWVMRENLKKNRLVKLDAAWVEKWLVQFE